jgi:hypothetical protein
MNFLEIMSISKWQVVRDMCNTYKCSLEFPQFLKIYFLDFSYSETVAGGGRCSQALKNIFSIFSNLFGFFPNFSYPELKISLSPCVGNQTNATWTPPPPSLFPPFPPDPGLSPNMRYNVSTSSTSLFSMSDALCTPATGPQHGAPHASLVAMVSVLFICHWTMF